MRPSRNINDVSSASGENPMFLRQLSSSGSSFLPRSRPALCRADSRGSRASSSSNLPHFIPPGPRPCWSGRGFPPWPPRLPHSCPAARQVFSGRPPHPRSTHPGNFGGGWHSFYTSADLMTERPDREPPYKRRKSAEERRSAEGGGGATGGKKKDGGSRREYHHLDPSADRDGSRPRGNDAAGKCDSRDKHTARTRRDETPNPGRSSHQHGGHKDSQPVGTRTQTPESKPAQDTVLMYKPNPWFKVEQQGLSSTALPSTPWQVSIDNTPPPPGTGSPLRQQEDVKPLKSLQRQWEASPADLHPPGGSTAFDFSVMSYNILSQELLQDNVYLYRHCQPRVLPWDHRLPNLLAEIQQHDADILCLQEVQEDHFENQIKPALQALGYQCEYKKRTGRKPDGCAVIFKTSRLSLLSSNPVEFFRPGDALLDRDNVALVVLLQPNDAAARSDPSAFICVANTHLLYNPRRGDIKLAQLAILLAEISRLSRPPDASANPVVLCGDFNSTPRSPLYSFLTSGCLKYRGLQIGMVSGQENSPRGQRLLPSPIWSHSLGISPQCQYLQQPRSPSVEGAISNLTVDDVATKAAAAASNSMRIEHSLKLQSSYQHRLVPDGRPEITTCHSRTAMTVDYILYTPESVTPPSLPGGRGLQLLGRLSLVGQSELEEVNGLPNHHHSSDHLPLLARFRFRC